MSASPPYCRLGPRPRLRAAGVKTRTQGGRRMTDAEEELAALLAGDDLGAIR